MPDNKEVLKNETKQTKQNNESNMLKGHRNQLKALPMAKSGTV